MPDLRTVLFVAMMCLFTLGLGLPGSAWAEDFASQWDATDTDDDSRQGGVVDSVLTWCIGLPFELTTSTFQGSDAPLTEFTSSSSGNSNSSSNSNNSDIIVLTSTTSVLLLLAVSIGITIRLASFTSRPSLVRAYIERNTVALRQDITLGGGETVVDLAAIFAVPAPHLSVFGNMLQQRHRTFMDMLTPAAKSDEAAEAFIQAVFAAMMQEAELAPNVFERIVGVEFFWASIARSPSLAKGT